MITLAQRKQAMLNQLNELKAQKDEAKATINQLDTGIKRLEGALLLITELLNGVEQPLPPATPSAGAEAA